MYLSTLWKKSYHIPTYLAPKEEGCAYTSESFIHVYDVMYPLLCYTFGGPYH